MLYRLIYENKNSGTQVINNTPNQLKIRDVVYSWNIDNTYAVIKVYTEGGYSPIQYRIGNGSWSTNNSFIVDNNDTYRIEIRDDLNNKIIYNLTMQDESNYVPLYGYLYNWYTINSADNISALGWKVPDNSDITTLTTYVNTTYNIAPNNFGVGCHLKSDRTQIGDPEKGFPTNDHPRWKYYNDNNFGRDTVGFRAVPAGTRDSFSTGEYYDPFDYRFSCWSSSQVDATRAAYLSIVANNNGAFLVTNPFESTKADGRSIRLIREAAYDSETDGILEDGDSAGSYIGNDGSSYDTVKIGTQIWLKYNLAETKFRNDSLIDIITDNTEWKNSTSPAMCPPNGDNNLV